jgi:hypothetical protein
MVVVVEVVVWFSTTLGYAAVKVSFLLHKRSRGVSGA